MDESNSRCAGISARTEPVSCASKEGKLAAVHSKCRAAKQRHKLDEDLNSLMKIIQEKEASLRERTNDGDVLQSRLKDIRQEKEATINRRKIIDDDLRALNNEKTGETFIKLRGSLQYRTEKALNEAISRLELQLTTHNYRVSEEKKIVQEIDRLKRSKKILKEYLSLEEQLNQMKSKQRMMRSQRDGLFREVTLLKADEDEIKKSSLENRNQIEQLKKDLDELHVQKRKALSELKQAVQPMLHLRELQHKRSHLRRRECGKSQAQQFLRCKKERNEGKLPDVLIEKEIVCNTLMAYLHKMITSPTSTPSTPVGERDSKIGASPLVEIHDGEMVLVLKKKSDEDEDFICQKSLRVPKKGKRDRKRMQQNRLLSHTPEMLHQFYKLDIPPPSSLNDVTSCLEVLAAKKEQLIHGKDSVSPKLSPEGRLPSIAECVGKIDINGDDHCDLSSDMSVCRHHEAEPNCDSQTSNSTAHTKSNEPVGSSHQLLNELSPPSSEVGIEDCHRLPRTIPTNSDSLVLNGHTDFLSTKRNHTEDLKMFCKKLEMNSDENENVSNGDARCATVEKNMVCSVQKCIQSEFLITISSPSSSGAEDVRLLDPHKVPLFGKPQPDCYLTYGVCNGDAANGDICANAKLDENLNPDLSSESGITYSI